VPTDVPLRIEHQALLLEDIQDIDEIRPLLADLFGADHLDTWIANGATARMLQVIIAWGMANATGTPTTFERAVELAAKAQAATAAGKSQPVPNRAARRAPSGTGKSASTGRSSSRTSAASTTSRRRNRELSSREFRWLLGGLSEQSVWRITLHNTPPTLTGQAAQEFMNLL